jgi:hypothetical protein
MNVLIQKYIDYSIEHGRFTLNGDHKNGNKAHKNLMNTLEKIKLENKEVKQEFYELLNFENDSVKIWTAVTLIETFKDKCVKVLSEIAKNNKTILSLNAETTLEMWKKGMLENLINWENK